MIRKSAVRHLALCDCLLTKGVRLLVGCRESAEAGLAAAQAEVGAARADRAHLRAEVNEIQASLVKVQWLYGMCLELLNGELKRLCHVSMGHQAL
jgi:hypothetical protein